MEKRKNYKRKNWIDNNQFFENELGYDEFVEAMMMAADEGDLPKVLEHKQPEILTINVLPMSRTIEFSTIVPPRKMG